MASKVIFLPNPLLFSMRSINLANICDVYFQIIAQNFANVPNLNCVKAKEHTSEMGKGKKIASNKITVPLMCASGNFGVVAEVGGQQPTTATTATAASVFFFCLNKLKQSEAARQRQWKQQH